MSRVLIPLAEDFEELEAVTVIDLLRRGQVEVTVAGLAGDQPVRGSRGTVIVPDVALERVADDDFDMLVLPGGLPGADHLAADTRLREMLQRHARGGRYTAAICAAPRALAAAGLLEGRQATCFPGALKPEEHPSLELDLERPVVVDGNLVTSRGPGTAMDFALDLLELLEGRTTRRDVEGALQRQPSA